MIGKADSAEWAKVVEIPCRCALYAAVDPNWEGFPCACACAGPGTWERQGRLCVLAFIQHPHQRPEEPPEMDLARLAAQRPAGMPLQEWLEAIQVKAAALLEEDVNCFECQV